MSGDAAPCVTDEGLALRSRPAGGGFKPPHAVNLICCGHVEQEKARSHLTSLGRLFPHRSPRQQVTRPTSNSPQHSGHTGSLRLQLYSTLAQAGVLETIAATTTKTGLTIGAELDTGSYDLGISVTPAEFHALPITPNAFHGDWNYTLSPVPPRAPGAPATTHRTDPALTAMLTDPALTGMSRTAFEYLVAVSEPFWDALAEAAFQRRFHRPRSYRHPQTSSVDHTHRLLAAILRRRRAVTMTFLAQLLGVNRTNLSIQYQDAKRLLDLHRILVTPIPGSPARTMEQLHARTTPAEPRR